jgi:hypothetical protein
MDQQEQQEKNMISPLSSNGHGESASDNSGSGRRRHGRNKDQSGGDVGGLNKLIPFAYFDLLEEQGRRDYIENMFGHYGKILGYSPFIVIMTVASTNPTAAIWSAFGISVFINLCCVYRHQ